MQHLTLKMPDGPLEYSISYRARLKKRLYMELDQSGGLVIVAPQHWSRTKINATLNQNTLRIKRFVNTAQQRLLAPLQYTDGEQHLYLGEYYPLIIRHVHTRCNSIEITAGQIRIDTPVLQAEKICANLQAWYRGQAMAVFSERLQVIARRTDWAGAREIPLQLRKMKRTWGNCSSAGVIKLNTHLIKAPPSVLDSVIAHELCHLRVMNHGKAFYRLLQNLNPDWRRDRTSLRAHGFRYVHA